MRRQYFYARNAPKRNYLNLKSGASRQAWLITKTKRLWKNKKIPATERVMQFQELKTTVKDIGVETSRHEDDNYLEVVIVKDKLTELIVRLDRVFGSAQERPSSRAKDVIKGFGGIIEGQILYFLHEGDSFIFAMLWPWQDGEHITLKMGRG
jgi:hypothetical protein